VKKLFLFSPLPPIKSGVARYSGSLAQQLAKDYEIHVITDQTDIIAEPLYEIHHWREYLRKPLERDAVIIYQIGNSPFHRYMFPFLFTFPGIVVLHDFILTDLSFLMLKENYSRQEIYDHLNYCICSENSAKQITELLLNGTLPPNSRYLFPELNKIIVDASIATVVHNPDTRQTLLQNHSKERVYCFPLGFWSENAFPETTEEEISKKRTALRLPKDAFILGHFGVLSSYKRADVLLELLYALRNQGCPAYLLIVGYETEYKGLERASRRMNVQDYVKQINSSSDQEYRMLMQCMDIGYSLRFPPVGEFSLSTAEIMASGKPLILLQHRFSSYLPDSVCIKISPENEIEGLLENTLHLYRSPDIRKEMGKKAKEYIRRTNSVQMMMDGYRSIIEAFEYLKSRWRDPRSYFPRHLQPLDHRVSVDLNERFGEELSQTILLPNW
jgi:glycosyltransferase involved in cell wall biosynthesis